MITAQSTAWIEEFLMWKAMGGGTPWSMPAKSVDALLTLDRAWQQENKREQQ